MKDLANDRSITRYDEHKETKTNQKLNKTTQHKERQGKAGQDTIKIGTDAKRDTRHETKTKTDINRHTRHEYNHMRRANMRDTPFAISG